MVAKAHSFDPFGLVGRALAGKYRIDRVIGQGGFGVVYAGLHTVLDTAIAIKCMVPHGNFDPAEVAAESALFLREAKVLFTLSHPAIVRLYDIGTFDYDGQVLPFVVLEFLPGRTLEQEIRVRASEGRRFTGPEMFDVFDPVLAAVEYAHANGVVHRDIKPSNIILGENRAAVAAKVVDFGIARITTDTRRSVTLRPFTPLYAAPEQWDPRLGTIDALSDVFSLGVVLAETAMLQPLLDPSRPIIELFEQAKALDAKKRLMMTRADLGEPFAEIVDRALRSDRRARIQSVTELRQQLRSVLATSSSPSLEPLVPSSRIVAAAKSGPAKTAPTISLPPIEPVSERPAPSSPLPSTPHRTSRPVRIRHGAPNMIAVDADRTVATWGPVLVVVWKGTVSVAAAREIQFALRDFAAARPDHDVALLTVVEAAAPMPSADARTALANILRFCADDVRCSAVAMEGDGFRAAAARSVATGLSLIARQPFPHRIFSTVDDASRWIASSLGRKGPSIEPEAFTAAVEKIRSHTASR